MFLSLLPITLALAHEPVASDEALDREADSVTHDRAQRSSRARSSRSGGRSSGDDERKRPSSGSSSSRKSSGKSSGDDRRDSDRDSKGSRESDRRDSDRRDSDRSRDSDRRDSDRDSRGSRDSGPRESSPRDSGSRDSGPRDGDRRDSDARRPSDARPSEHRTSPSEARPSSSGSRESRPDARSGPQPVTRHLSTSGSRSSRPTTAGSPPQSRHVQTPSNFRTTSRSKGSHASRDTGSREEASRHGRSHEEATRAHHTASSHRHASSYASRSRAARHARSHHTAAQRHRAWVSHHHRYNRHWYHPSGWFVTWRPGRPAYWYHGVFVYGPGPWHPHHDHVVVVRDGDSDGGGRDSGDSKAKGPVRKVDRAGSFSVGIRGGSYMGAYSTGDVYGDAGLGIAARYRPVEAVGLELSWQYHDETWSEGTERINQPLQASVELFAMPWTKVNPYVLAGVTVNARNVQDQVGPFFVESDDPLWGPHAGVGIEFGLGQKASVNFDARYVGYLNKPEGDLTRPGAFGANMGLNFYF